MSDSNHIDKIKAEQRELLKQFEQSLQDNFKRLMNNASNPIQKNITEDNSDEDDIDSDEDFREIEKQVKQNIVNNVDKKDYGDLFEESSDSEISKDNKNDRDKQKEEIEESNSEMEMVSKFSDNKDDSKSSDDYKDIISDKNQKTGNNSKTLKSRTQQEFNKPQGKITPTSQIRASSGSKRPPLTGTTNGQIPLRSRTPQPSDPERKVVSGLKNTNSMAKYNTRCVSNRSGTFSANNNKQKEIFNNSKLNTSLNKKTRNSIVSAYSIKNDRNADDYKAKYERLTKDHNVLKEKFSSLYDKHQRLLKLFNKLEEKYRIQSDKLRSTSKPQNQPKASMTKVTVPKTIVRPASGKRPSNPQRKI